MTYVNDSLVEQQKNRVSDGPSPPTYRTRLRLEGLVLAGSSAIAVAVVAVAGSPKLDLLFAGQVVLGVLLLVVFGRRSARKAISRSSRVEPARAGSGEPTPLWHVVAIVVVLTPVFWLIAGAISGLSFAVGAALVGLTQVFVMEPTVAHDERVTARRYVRQPGSRLGRGTRLAWLSASAG